MFYRQHSDKSFVQQKGNFYGDHAHVTTEPIKCTFTNIMRNIKDGLQCILLLLGIAIVHGKVKGTVTFTVVFLHERSIMIE